MANLIIVESPTKAKTISRFVGKSYEVLSSYGHVRDLPKSKLGIDVENDFEPQYIVPKKNQKRVNELKKTAKNSDEVILATDEDREGEAIAWHLAQTLGLEDSESGARDKKGAHQTIKRIVFHEITKTAIDEALKNPREIDINLVNAQQARRVLDRLVGYKLSPFLWKKIARGLSAGRVQSVALRLIVDRENEIKEFKPQEYWSIVAVLKNGKGEFEAELSKIGEDVLEKISIGSEKEAKKITSALTGSAYKIEKIERKESKRNPLPPFTTSTLQQASAHRLGYSAQKTMFIAQQLYENGFITYMRTDSVNVSKDALEGAKKWIHENLPEEYRMPEPRVFRGKSRLAQEAHEAIRPSRPDFLPADLPSGGKGKESLGEGHKKVYDLIWRRFMASQLPEARFDSMRVDVLAENGSEKYVLRANGNVMRFDGFLKIWKIKYEDKNLPEISETDVLRLIEVKSDQHFTEPPPRYNEASLIKTLEKFGIGRPSTYAPIISVIQGRDYVEKMEGRFYPTEMGTLVNKVLTENFSEIVDIQFTAKMEDELDDIAEGQREWRKVVKEFYDPFSKHLEEKYEAVSRKELVEEKTDEVCEKCGKPMIVKLGRFGKFLACSGFPDCKNTKTLKEPPKLTGIACPKCKEGELLERKVSKKGRARGKIFWGCNRYPECDFAVWEDPTKIPPVYPPLKKPRYKKKNSETE